jgi:bifunctional DNase/RNase
VMDLLQMSVKVVGLDQSSMVPVVILTDADERYYLPVVIGPGEANAIAVVLEGLTAPRPLTHDLLLNTIRELGASVERVAITELKDDVFYARISLKRNGQVLELDARPSDSIALALRAGVPIFVSEQIVTQSAMIKQVEDPELEEFRAFLKDLSPDDFRK